MEDKKIEAWLQKKVENKINIHEKTYDVDNPCDTDNIIPNNTIGAHMHYLFDELLSLLEEKNILTIDNINLRDKENEYFDYAYSFNTLINDTFKTNFYKFCLKHS